MVTGREGGVLSTQYILYVALLFCWYCQDLLFVAVAERESVLDGGGGGGVCVNDIYKWGLELLGFGNQ